MAERCYGGLHVFFVKMEEVHENQSSEIKPYMFEPEQKDRDGEIASAGSSDNSSSLSEEDEVDDAFEAQHKWRLTNLSWCKYGNCELMTKTVESFLLPQEGIRIR